MNQLIQAMICLFAIMLVASCSNDVRLDKEIRQIIEQKELDADFQPDHKFNNKILADLGAELFFSPDLSIDGKVSCASCHHPDKAGADGIPLPIGIGGGNSENVGDERIKAAEKVYSKGAINGLIPRNTPTVFNAALYRNNLFWDGRAQYGVDEKGQKKIRTGFNVSPVNPTKYEENSLLQTQARMPITSAFEMKGSLHSNKNNFEIEQEVIQFLRTSEKWCQKFNKVFQLEDCNKSITLTHLTQAISEFQSSLVFIDSPFEKYIRGDKEALGEAEKRGTLLFFKNQDQGGLGCSNCHAGKIFSNERFYNLGIHASGMGGNEEGYDFGRKNVDRTVRKFSFKTPGLLNITQTAPYFHNGTALTLEEAIKFHVQDKKVNKSKNAIKIKGIDYDAINVNIDAEFNEKNKDIIALLPKSISNEQMQDLLAFLSSLTDPCLTDRVCTDKFKRAIIETPRQSESLVPKISHSDNKARVLDYSTVMRPEVQCANKNNVKNDKSGFFFSAHNNDIGLTHTREVGLIKKGWLMDIVNHGGMSVMDVNYDCLDDVIFDAGANGFIFYTQTKDGMFLQRNLPFAVKENSITPLIMDVDGDYKFDLFVGNQGQGSAFIAFDFLNQTSFMSFDGLSGPVINASIADVDNDNDMDMVFAFWRSYKTLQQEHIWLGDGNGNLTPQDKKLALRESDHDASIISGKFLVGMPETPVGNTDVTFTPNFIDIDLDGDQDLLLAADFVRSQVLRNDNGIFTDITQKDVIDESNGMGAAIGDFENDGLPDWYVSSINHIDKNIGGNNLYKNIGKGLFKKLDNGATIFEESWSWGACAKDFNNDGYEDIFYVSGYGEPLDTAQYEVDEQKKSNQDYLASQSKYRNSYPRLLINNKNGGFVDQSQQLGFDKPFDGRGIACFDYEQDGDIDIVINPIDGAPKLYKNHLNGTKNWIAFRLIGLSKNTEAFGAKIAVYTKAGIQNHEIRFENNYLSRNPAQIHFGIDDLKEVEKVVVYLPSPNNKTVDFGKLEVNKLHVLTVEQLLNDHL